MCIKCTENPRLKYSTIYTEAWNSKNKEIWLEFKIKESKKYCTRYRNYLLQFLLIALKTQSIFENAQHLKYKLKQEIELTKKQIQLPIKKIQYQTLKRLYRPNGPMFKKSINNLDFLF